MFLKLSKLIERGLYNNYSRLCVIYLQHWENAKLYSRGTDKRFLRDNYLSGACFEMVSGIRTQLLGQLRSSGFVKSKGGGDLRDLNVNSDNWALVKGVLTGSMYPNICAIDREKNCLYNE